MSTVGYYVQEKTEDGKWFSFSINEQEEAARTLLDTLKIAYPDPKQFRLVKRTVTDEVIG